MERCCPRRETLQATSLRCVKCVGPSGAKALGRESAVCAAVAFSGPARLDGRNVTGGRSALAGCRARLSRKSLLRSGLPTFFLQRLRAGPRASSGRLATRMTLALFVIASRFLARACRGFSATGWFELYACAPCFRQADRYRLFRRGCTMFSFADVMYLFANKFSRLCAGRLAFACVFARPFKSPFFRHGSPPEMNLLLALGGTASNAFCKGMGSSL